MRRIAPLFAAAIVLFITMESTMKATMAFSPGDKVALPEPRYDGSLSLEGALAQRRSVRNFAPGAVTLDEVSQLLWSAQGMTGPQGHRAAPSAGALYPLEIYLVTGNVVGLEAGVYKYIPRGHFLTKHRDGNRLAALSTAAWDQSWIRDASCILVIAADIKRTAVKYGERAERYVHMEVGHAAQNVYLQTAALGLGTTMVGAFKDAEVKRLMKMAATESPLALLPIGRLRR
jgi:SagB-type dehydrogenase family enzyme